MRPKQRKVAAKNMLELDTAEVDADSDSVGSDTSLSAACRCCNSGDSFSAKINFRRHSLSRGEGQGLGRRHVRGDGASETQFLSSFRDVEQLFPDWEDEYCDTFVFRR